MLKHVKRLLAATSAVTVASLVAVGGLTVASASPAAQPSVSGIEHFQLMTTSATANRGQVIAYGLFTAAGVNLMGQPTDTFKLRGGSFQVKHSPGHGRSTFDPRTCLLTLNLHGTYKVSHGTGKYAGISGHGRYRLSILALGARNSNGKCSQNKPPLAFQQIIRASGPVHL